MIPNPKFKGTPLFDVECLRNGKRQIRSYNGILQIRSYSRVSFRMTLSDLAKYSINDVSCGWRKYSGLVVQVQRKFRSDSVHVAPLETAGIILLRSFHIAGQCHTGPGVALAGCDGGLGLGVGLAGCRFLCAGKYIALLIQHEWGGPQHPAHEGVKSPGILFEHKG